MQALSTIQLFFYMSSSSKPLVYDGQELFRWMIDLIIIKPLEDYMLKKKDFITAEDYHT